MEPDPDMQQHFGFVLREPSSTIDMLWADCDLSAFWSEIPEELTSQQEYRLAA